MMMDTKSLCCFNSTGKMLTKASSVSTDLNSMIICIIKFDRTMLIFIIVFYLFFQNC